MFSPGDMLLYLPKYRTLPFMPSVYRLSLDKDGRALMAFDHVVSSQGGGPFLVVTTFTVDLENLVYVVPVCGWMFAEWFERIVP